MIKFYSVLKLLALMSLAAFLSGCATIKLGPSFNQPLKEQQVEEGKSDSKVLIINIDGILNDQPNRGLLASSPSLLDKVMMQLKKAEKDKQIVAVLLKVNSPGGGVTVSQILHHELMAFKERSGKKLFVQMMSVAASGGVYISMAADHIQAHPATITGSVGVISMSADLSGTMDKIGAKVNVYKTGENKDMGSPFKAASKSDRQAFTEMVENMATDFYSLVQKRNNLNETTMDLLKTARVITGDKAKELGLVDSIGYLSDATQKACELAKAKECNVVTYRFAENQNATAYSPSMQTPTMPANVNLIDIPMLESLQLPAGVYYLYLQ